METAEEFGLDEIIMHSYIRQFDPKTQVSASDMAYAISSLLEHPIATKDTENQNPNNSNRATQITGVHDCLFDNFWQAYDALDLKQTNTQLLLKGIELAKEMQ
jgi:hypothetical protein